MNNASRSSTSVERRTISLAAALALAAGSAWLGSPASARPDPGDLRFAAMDSVRTALWPPEGQCPLRRVGTQYVRCDLRTGAGAQAPNWIPELYPASLG